MWAPGDVIAIGALAVAALTLIFTYLDRRQGRSESYRAALYSAEVSLVADVVRELGEAHLAAKRFVRPATGEDHGAALSDFGEALSRAGLARDAGIAILRRNVLRAFETDIQMLLGIVFPEGEADTDLDRRAEIEKAWTTLTEALRKELGANTLGDQVRELTGVAGQERAEVRREGAIRKLDMELEVRSRGRYKAPLTGRERAPPDEPRVGP
ncbi:MAG TPA: hypothetical protein VES62_07775 [Thermoleophilaceae bacterium]|nr:hypothetical protein [Thermoleophilaceae bacterium]